MPINNKLLSGPYKHVHSEEAKDCAFNAGARAFREGKRVSDCPEEFRIRNSDSVLYDSWITGFRAEKTVYTYMVISKSAVA